MSALEKIFQGYYEERLDGAKPDPEKMQQAHENISVLAEMVTVGTSADIMEEVSTYGAEAEKTGFMAGFKMAWELLKNMQEG